MNNNVNLQKNTIPHWNMQQIWKSFSDSEYKKSIEKLQQLIKQISYHVKNPIKDFNQFLKIYLSMDNELGSLSESLYAYSYSIYATDTTNTDSLNNMALLEELQVSIADYQLVFRQILKENQTKLSSFFHSFPEYKKYEFILEEEISYFNHQMERKEESIANDLQRFGGDAWSKLHEQIISNLVDKETGKTFNQLRNDAYSPDRNIRKESYYKEIALLEQNQIAISSALNNIKGATISLNKKRNWGDGFEGAINRSLFSSRLSRKSLDALISAIEDSIPMWQEYLFEKAKALNLKDEKGNSEKCSFYDIFAPLITESSDKEKYWTYQEAKEFIINKFSEFSSHMGDFVKTAFEENWVDAEIRKGKVGGAFCIDFPLQKVSRVLTNFSGTTSDILTLAHELGHAYHHFCIKDLDYNLCSYPMTLAETASIFAETMVTNSMLKTANLSEKINLLEMHLSDSCQTLLDILSRFYFEKSVFEERENKELVAEDFCRLMKDAQNKTYGNSLTETKHPYLWAVKTHYYSPSLDFYNFPYAFGQLFALGLYSQYKESPKEFPSQYQELLKNTGSMTCEEVCKLAGFDITTKDFWLSGIKELKLEFEEWKTCLKVTKKEC
ncbi:MAG: M3 family oligoendopeptidase [Spirochaetaceae bacterium]|nr:M3 family oligoendopeptidase [Spirochaetaceae bacterium]